MGNASYVHQNSLISYLFLAKESKPFPWSLASHVSCVGDTVSSTVKTRLHWPLFPRDPSIWVLLSDYLFLNWWSTPSEIMKYLRIFFSFFQNVSLIVSVPLSLMYSFIAFLYFSKAAWLLSCLYLVHGSSLFSKYFWYLLLNLNSLFSDVFSFFHWYPFTGSLAVDFTKTLVTLFHNMMVEFPFPVDILKESTQLWIATGLVSHPGVWFPLRIHWDFLNGHIFRLRHCISFPKWGIVPNIFYFQAVICENEIKYWWGIPSSGSRVFCSLLMLEAFSLQYVVGTSTSTILSLQMDPGSSSRSSYGQNSQLSVAFCV